MRSARLLLLILAFFLLAGCDGLQLPVNGKATATPLGTPRPSPSPAPLKTETIPAVTLPPAPTPSPKSPVPYAFPLKESGLCGAAPLPGGFSRALYIREDGSMFLFATQDGRIAQGLWGGLGYRSAPAVEGVETGLGPAFYMDAANNRLCCAGSRLFEDGRKGPAVVVADLKTGARCNADELCGWKETNCALSGGFQYCGGMILAQVMKYTDGAYAPLERWAILNLAGKSSSVLDRADILDNRLEGWQDAVSFRLALTGPKRLLAACLAHRVNAETGADEYACLAFELDLRGRLQESGEIMAAGKTPEALAITSATLFDASPDGKYLLYSDARGKGIYLLDLANGVEYTVLDGASGTRTFTEWGQKGVFYYGAEGANGERTIYRTSASEAMKAK